MTRIQPCQALNRDRVATPTPNFQQFNDMTSLKQLGAAFLSALVLLSTPADAKAQTYTGPARVVDGDTLYIGKLGCINATTAIGGACWQHHL